MAPRSLANPADARLSAPPLIEKCVICDDTNLDRSHAIPESIGGLWNPKLLCGPCNSGFGSVVEQDLHLDAGLRLAHEHYQWALPSDRRWIKDFRRGKQFFLTYDGREQYARYAEDGTRSTSFTA